MAGDEGALSGSARLALVDGVTLLRPDEQVFEAMLEGWRNQGLARNLASSTVLARERQVRAFQAHAGVFPWEWTALHADEWFADLRAVHHCTRSTLRGYQVAVRQAEQAARELETAGFDSQAIMLLTPEIVLREIGKVDGKSDLALPPVGTESATIHKYLDLAREGHHALMVHAPSDEDAERVMSAVRHLPFSYAQKYHLLAIEDLE